jgi:hypothetical protein
MGIARFLKYYCYILGLLNVFAISFGFSGSLKEKIG